MTLIEIIHKIFGYKCPECGGMGRICVWNGCEAGCNVCNGKGRIRIASKSLEVRDE
jgi:DnaJ-class molecular chaperone